jgi:hypothetical protein
MDAITKTTVLTCTIVVALLMLLASGGGTFAGTTMSGEFIRGGSSGATGWIWISALVAVIALCIALVALICEDE